MKITLNDIMELPIFNDARIIAGHAGAKKEVKSVTVAEVPDAADWLNGGELVVTTAYFLKDNSEKQKSWLTSLIEGQAVALAIKPERFLGNIPEAMIDIADEFSFPLIRLPHKIDWPQIIENVMNAINQNKSEIIKRSEDIHNKLTQIVLREDGLEIIADTMASLVNNLIIVEDNNLEALAVGYPDQDNREEFDDLLKFRGKIFLNEFRKNEYYKDKVENCNYNIEENTQKNCSNKIYTYDLNYKDSNYTQLTIPIIANSVTYGFLTLIEYYGQTNEVDIVALEHGATTIALDLTKKRAVYETKKRLKKDFLNDLFSGNINNSLVLKGKYNFINYEVEKATVAIILEIERSNQDFSENNYSSMESNKKTLKIINTEFSKSGQNYFIYEEGNRIIILFQFAEIKDEEEIYNKISERCKNIGERVIQYKINKNYYFGIGGLYHNSAETKKSYEEAKKALKIGKIFIEENEVFIYKRLGIYRILSMIEKEGEVIEFCKDFLGDLIKYDKKHNENLCYNLKKYLMNNGNVTKAAKELYIHPNTLAYRIKKIEKILKKDLDDPRERFNLFLALMIKKSTLKD
ncbi:MAG TPA: PucR family transcriptional regulator ligand-binding domain-containing protein [Halanaerobiales bacterium]|nr:PucR family transcriptional regulator ligand-binding domain-containing protein [Halanaerobiales bacterium]